LGERVNEDAPWNQEVNRGLSSMVEQVEITVQNGPYGGNCVDASKIYF